MGSFPWRGGGRGLVVGLSILPFLCLYLYLLFGALTNFPFSNIIALF